MITFLVDKFLSFTPSDQCEGCDIRDLSLVVNVSQEATEQYFIYFLLLCLLWKISDAYMIPTKPRTRTVESNQNKSMSCARFIAEDLGSISGMFENYTSMFYRSYSAFVSTWTEAEPQSPNCFELVRTIQH